jgi:hypothetical protein
MELKTFKYQLNQGWSVERFPDLDSDRTLVIVFGAPGFIDNAAPIEELSRAYSAAKMVGCSTAGEIFGTMIADHSLSVAVLRFESAQVRTALERVHDVEDSYRAGEMLAHQLYEPGLRSVLVLSDGISVNGSALVRGLNAILPDSVVVTGGLAGDGERFGRTWVIKDSVPESGYISAAGFYGESILVGHGSKGGWDIFGPERTVTRSSGNILYELDGKPALQLYKEYLGDRAEGLPASAMLFPLALRAESGGMKQIVRTVLGVNEAHNSMVFAGDIPEGYRAQLMKANFDRLVDGASIAAQQVWESSSQGSPQLAIAISCVGRRMVLGERTEEELEAACEILPEGTWQIGFYSYGEISPFTTGQCDLHNQTMTLTTISEA